MLPVYDIASQYRRLSELCTPNLTNTKYCLCEMIKPHLKNGPAFENIAKAKTQQQIKQAIELLKQESQNGINNRTYIVTLLAFTWI